MTYEDHYFSCQENEGRHREPALQRFAYVPAENGAALHAVTGNV